MAPRSPIAAYQAENQTITQQRLLVLLYDRLLRDIDDAERAIRDGNRFECNKALVHAQEIVAELELALDPAAWDASKELSTLYVYIHGRLVRANVSFDLEALLECRATLAPMRDAWEQAWLKLSSTVPTTSDARTDAEHASSATPTPRIAVDVAG